MAKKKYTKEFLDKLSDELIGWYKTDENIWLKDFAISKGLHSEYLTRFAKENENFSQALKKAKEIQESKLVKQGLSGKAIPFVIFALKNVAGWRDNQEDKSGLTENELNQLRKQAAELLKDKI